MVVDALGLRGGAQLISERGVLLQIGGAALQQLDLLGGGGGGQPRLLLGQLALLFAQLLLGGLAVQRDLRVLPGDQRQQLIHLFLHLEYALLLRAAVVLHHQIGLGGEHALAGEAALAQRHALVDAVHGVEGHIEFPLDVEAVEVDGLFAHAAGADLRAVLSVLGQLRVGEPSGAYGLRFD